jgi:uncharacterized protein
MSTSPRLVEIGPVAARTTTPSKTLTFALLLFGATGLVIGIGVGMRWLLAGAVGWRMVIGILALVVGILSIGFGLARIGQNLGLWARATLRSILIILIALLVWTLTPAVVATNVPLITHDVAPEEFGLAAHEVRYTADDGTEMFAWYLPPTEGKVAVLRHGSGSTASNVLPHARVLVDNGFGVLLADARGHGESGGDGMDFGWYGTADIDAAIDFLTTQPEVDIERIVVVGLSMGGEEAIGAAASDRRIAAVVAEGAFARTEADKAWLTDAYGWRGWVQVRLEWLQYALTELLTSAPKPDALAESAALASPTPILMITAGNVADEAAAARHIQQAAGGNVVVWSVPGAGHTGGLTVDSAAWEERVITFLDSALGRN